MLAKPKLLRKSESPQECTCSGRKEQRDAVRRCGCPWPSPHPTMETNLNSGLLLGRRSRGRQSRKANDTISCICSVSFHRNHTATVRSQVENPAVSHVENEYSQPPRNSHASAYAGKQQPGFQGEGRLEHRSHPETGCPRGVGALTAL